MVDISVLRRDPKEMEETLKKRGMQGMLKTLKTLLKKDEHWRKTRQELESLRRQRNEITQQIKEAKSRKKDAQKLLSKAKSIPGKIKKMETDVTALKQETDALLQTLPNLLHPSVPSGSSDAENKVVKQPRTIPPIPFPPRSHVDLLDQLGGADIPRAAKTSGARFFFLTNDLVVLDHALMMFALDTLRKKGYQPISPPLMIRREPYAGVTDIADFEDVIYKIEGEDLYLIATSEHAIAAMHMNEILDADRLPIRYVGISPCFRKEAGAHGRDTRGIFRVHQFNKVEQFIFSTPEDSWKLQEELRGNAEYILTSLEIPYRVVNLCGGDIGKASAKTYDLEGWFPAQKAFKELISCSNVTDYQSAKLKIRYRDPSNGEMKLVHTLNSTALATTRAMVAILENFQQEDGSVKIPRILHPYTFGIKELMPPENK